AQAGPPPSRPASLRVAPPPPPPPPRPLREHPSAPGRRAPHPPGPPARHERDLVARGMGALHVGLHVLLRPRPGKGDHGGPQSEGRGERIVLDIEQQEVQGKRPIRKFANRSGPGIKLLGPQIITAHPPHTPPTP